MRVGLGYLRYHAPRVHTPGTVVFGK
jgi:hypothetical protein